MLCIGSVALHSPLLLAPIAGHCDLAFRLVVRAVSATPACGGGSAVGLAYTELLCSHAVVRDPRIGDRALWRAATCPEDQPLGVQLYGADARVLAEAARWAQDHGATIIDINMGCPVDKVTKTNGGSMLLCHPEATVALARQVVEAVRIPVTAKIRLGWDDARIVGPTLAPALADVGIAAITVHGRTTQQMFRGQVSLAGIAEVVKAVKTHHPDVPVIGNGDVRAPQDAQQMIQATGCDGVMIGRGALGQPWLFRDTLHYLTTGQIAQPLSRAERIRIVLGHFNRVLDLRGERAALHMARNRMSWYSPHLQPWPHLRRDMRTMGSAGQFRDYLEHGPTAKAVNAKSQAPNLKQAPIDQTQMDQTRRV